MEIVGQLQELTSAAIQEAYAKTVAGSAIVVNSTRPDQTGDFTVVTFGLARTLSDAPAVIAERLGAYLAAQGAAVASYEVVKGFLNLSLSDKFWQDRLSDARANASFGQLASTGVKTVLEFSSPNTNKPLHLGHVRNILLGWSLSKILAAAGQEVKRVQIINDRGIAICKSMVAWKHFANGETPASSGRKGDIIVGDYYVRFEKELAAEYAAWQATPAGVAVLAKAASGKKGFTPAEFKNTYFNEHSALGSEARQMLLDWEEGKTAVRELWQTMNGWVYEGHNATYERLGVSFDKLYYESDTYVLGKEMAKQGLESGAFFQKEDGSVWADLTNYKLDQKIILRADGTSVYITQDLGTAHLRYEDFAMDRMIYVTGDEQNYHFQALFATLKLLDEPYADQLNHLGYGMIDLTTGKMKTREGTVVDADDLMEQVVAEARTNAAERAETSDQTEQQRATSAEQVGMAALKYFILRVNPRKRMTFDPTESVDLQGATGPYIQYAYVRASGVVRQAEEQSISRTAAQDYSPLAAAERDLVKHLLTLPDVLRTAAADLDPAAVASYAYSLAKGYHRFWHDHSVLNADNQSAIAFRLALSEVVASCLRKSMDLLGISLPERM